MQRLDLCQTMPQIAPRRRKLATPKIISNCDRSHSQGAKRCSKTRPSSRNSIIAISEGYVRKNNGALWGDPLSGDCGSHSAYHAAELPSRAGESSAEKRSYSAGRYGERSGRRRAVCRQRDLQDLPPRHLQPVGKNPSLENDPRHEGRPRAPRVRGMPWTRLSSYRRRW